VLSVSLCFKFRPGCAGGNTEAQRSQIGREMCETEQCGGRRLVSRRSLHTTKLCALCVSVFQIPSGDARTGKHRGTEVTDRKGKCVKQKRVQWRRSLYSTQLCALCVSVFQIPSRMRGRGKHRGTEVTDRKGKCVKQKSVAGEDWCRDAVSTQPNFVLSVSLCFKFRPGCADGETQRHRGHRSEGNSVKQNSVARGGR
jgi:hypothetical protein